MNSLFKHALPAALAAILGVSALAGCGQDTTNTGGGNSDVAFNELANTVEDSSDLPDWEGKQIKLKVWYALGMGGRRNTKPEKDVVTPELTRVTGVTIDPETSFENNEELMDAKLGKIVASSDWPDVVMMPERAGLQKMIDAGVVYDLSEYFPKYCTNLVNYYSKDRLQAGLKSERTDGKMYYFYYSPNKWALKYTNPEIPVETLNREVAQADPYPYVYVRDDILKMIYPEAKTQEEIEQMYVEKGEFAEEDILDVTFKTKEEFIDFLYKVRDLGIKEGNKDVSAFYTISAPDNWGLLTGLGGLYGYNMNGDNGANYFTYWDKETKQIEYMFKQPFFKEMMWDYTKLVADGVASKEAIVDQRADFDTKVSNGLYAVLYGFDVPKNDVLKQSGKSYQYRKVYLTIEQNQDKFLFAESNPLNYFVAILNKNVKEEDLPQILRYFDFCASDAGQKLSVWGPRSAGLFTETDGKRTYTDPELEACMVYDAQNKRDEYYNLKGKSWPNYPYFEPNKYLPKLSYDIQRQPTGANQFFSMGTVQTPELTPSLPPNIWEFDGYGVEGVQNFWRARTTFEESIVKMFVTTTREEFDKAYQDMVDTATKLGLDDATLEEINAAYKELNQQYMSELE